MKQATVGKVRGLVCTVNRQGGQIRLTFDDVVLDETSVQAAWKKEDLFTWREFPEEKFLRSSLSQEELADIGLNIVARLASYSTG